MSFALYSVLRCEHTKLLDELLVLVQLLQGINIHGVDSGLGGLLNVLHISKHANAELDLGDVGEFHLVVLLEQTRV